MMRVSLFSSVCGLAFAAMLAGATGAVTLSTGVGDGELNVTVDAFGAFGTDVGGDAGSALYDPVATENGNLPESDTVYESYVAMSFANTRVPFSKGDTGRQFMNDADFASAVFTAVDVAKAVSRFTFQHFAIKLEQSVAPSFDNGARVGAILNQVYRITNTGDTTSSGDIVRYLDGDLDFDGSNNDGGGRLNLNGSEVLYETDATGGAEAQATFVGITATGGDTPVSNRYQISAYDALLSNVISGLPLADHVESDDNGDGFVDTPYDVTLALRNTTSIAPNQTLTYTTQTLFGNAVPPAPGDLEALPLLPDASDPNGPFVFTVELEEDDVVWIDPVIATGYVYTLTSDGYFSSVVAPSLAAVNDPNGYTLTFTGATGAQSVTLAAGQGYGFSAADMVRMFTISGIDESLMLDPDNPTVFVTGVSVAGLTAGQPSVITMEPIRTDIPDVSAPVPLPAGGVLLLSGLAALGLRARRSAMLA